MRISPVRVVASSHVKDAGVLVSPRFGQVPEGAWARGSGCVMENSGEGSWLILDFGRELHGGVRILSGAPSRKGARVRLRFGESVSEACSSPGERGASNDHAIRDDEVRLPSFGSRYFGDTGFRFVRIDSLDSEPLQIEAVLAEEIGHDLPMTGGFRCSDERVNRVFETAVRTLRLCMQDYVWDGIKRDRLVWQGDMHPELMGALAVFGDTEVFRRSLDYMRDITPPGSPMQGIKTYTLWWIRCQRALYGFSGDREYLGEQGEYLAKVVDVYAERHLCDSANGMDSFLDWPTHDNAAAEIVGARALKILAFEDAAFLASVLGDEETRRKAVAAAARLRTLDFDAHGSKQVAALCALAGTIPPETAYAETLGLNGASGVSTFYGYYMLEAMSLAHRTDCGLVTLRDYWGAMLDMGATSFWEDFDVAWTNNAFRMDEMPVPGKRDLHGDFGKYCYKGFRHSLCHGWSCGPAPWLINNVLGIRPLDPGCRRVSVNPDLGDLEWAEGSMALPDGGAVKVRVERGADGILDVSVCAPEGVEIVRGVSYGEMALVYETAKTPHKVGVVLEPDEGKMLDNPNVFRYGDRWWMLYIQFDRRGYETHLAESEDLVHWKKLGCMLPRGAAGSWDVAQADGGPSLMDVRWDGPNTLGTFDGKYWMTYIGGAKEGYETDPLSIGIAYAPTPTNEWLRTRAKPALAPSDADARPFERRTLYKSFVMDDPGCTLGSRFVMYYNAKHEKAPQYESIGMAVSDDMVNWRRHGPGLVVANGAPGEAFAISGDPMVRKIGDLWVMFYFGCGWEPGAQGAFDTFAVSRDLVNWTKWEGAPLVAPSEPWDAQHAHKPWVLRHGGITYHYYCAVGDRGRVLALATSAPVSH